mgnify:FL=1
MQKISSVENRVSMELNLHFDRLKIPIKEKLNDDRNIVLILLLNRIQPSREKEKYIYRKIKSYNHHGKMRMDRFAIESARAKKIVEKKN